MLTSFKEYILVKKECLAFFEQKGKNNKSTSDLDVTTMPQQSVPQSDKELDIFVDDTVDISYDAWLKFGALYLVDSDRETLMNGEWLNDAHMSVFQYLLKTQFPQLNGLRSVLTQNLKNTSLRPLPKDSIQILHVNGNHWIAVSTMTQTLLYMTHCTLH